MITIKRFVFNAFQENTYVLSDETNECIIIDPGMDSAEEEEQMNDYISEHHLKPVLLVNTHTHIDHILGNSFIASHYKLKLAAHKDSAQFIHRAKGQAQMFGMEMDSTKSIDIFLSEEETPYLLNSFRS